MTTPRGDPGRVLRDAREFASRLVANDTAWVGPWPGAALADDEGILVRGQAQLFQLEETKQVGTRTRTVHVPAIRSIWAPPKSLRDPPRSIHEGGDFTPEKWVSRKEEVVRRGADRWDDRGVADAIVTDQRILLKLAGGGGRAYPLGQVSSVRTDLDALSVRVDVKGVKPICLVGEAAPQLGLGLCWAKGGEAAVKRDQALRHLLVGDPLEQKALRFIAGQEAVVPEHVARWVGWSKARTESYLGDQVEAEALSSYSWAPGRSRVYRICAEAQRLLDPNLPALEPTSVQALPGWFAAGWMWIVCHEATDAFGPFRAVLSRREAIAADRSGRAFELLADAHGAADSHRFGQPLASPEAYPDIVFVLANGSGWVPIQFVLTPNAVAWVGDYTARLLANPRFLAALVVARGDELIAQMRARGEQLGLGNRLQVRPLARGIGDGSPRPI